MTKTLTVDGTNRTSVLRLTEMIFSECANRGQVGAGQVVIDDPGAALTIGGMKPWSLTESAASQTRVVTGWTNERALRRGPFRGSSDRQIVVTLQDLNTFLDDILLSGSAADRPAETDYARVTWLLTQAAMTSADYGAVVAGQVPNSGTVSMDATDYRGQPPRTLLDDCAQASGKNFFLYWDTGSVPKLWYDDAATSAGLTSTLKISALASDVNNSTVFAPIFPDGTMLKSDPTWVKSKVRLKHKSGSVEANDASVASTYRQREHYTQHHRRAVATGSAQATKWVNKLGTEIQLSRISIIVPLANVNDVRAGSRVQLKIPAAGISSYTYYRVIQRDIEPAPSDTGQGPSDVLYRLTLTFMDDVRPTKLHHNHDDHQGTQVNEERSNATYDDATVIIDRGGITVTNGAITVTNGSGTVIIDGTSDMMRIASTGTLQVGPASQKGNYAAMRKGLATGLTYHPANDWYFTLTGYSAGWRTSMEHTDVGQTGLVLNQWFGMARSNGGTKTDVRVVLNAIHPPTPRVTARYYVWEQAAI